LTTVAVKAQVIHSKKLCKNIHDIETQNTGH